MSARTVVNPPVGSTANGQKLGGWWHETDDGRMICDLCPRECNLKPGDRGFCFVRQNLDGQMILTTYGRSTGFCIDPIEKKPLNHFLPGTSVLSFGTAGCNLGCKFCQNHDISKAREVELLSEHATPETIANAAVKLGCASVAYTYNDPIIWAEYAIDTAKACRQRGIKSVAVTAGYISPQARSAFFEYFDAANVDLKAFTEEFYYQLTLSHLKPVLETIEWLKKETDVWFEITNLIIPVANDSTDELRRLCDWVLDHVGDEVPLHFSAFHPDFKMLDRPRTPHETLLRGYEIARAAGVKYPYVGNVNDSKHQSTYCPNCNRVLIERNWYELGEFNIVDGKCKDCGNEIAGRFSLPVGDWGRKRQRVAISDFAPKDEKPRIVARGNSINLQRETSMTTALVSSAEQQQLVLKTACELVAAAVTGRTVRVEPSFEEVAKTEVHGAYVSLKREGRLRGCCGFIGQPTLLGPAIARSATQTAKHDPRLPPVSPTELRYLDVEVWLLKESIPVTAKGEDRRKEIKVGRDGLVISRGKDRGLLLPGVATDNEFDEEEFLQQVCRKAGLPLHAWKEDDTQLHRFEGQCIVGKFDESVWQQSAREATPVISEQDFAVLLSHCRQNVDLLQRGAVASCYLPGVTDGMVNGLAMSISHPSRTEPIHLTRISLRPPMPLQSSLYSLAENASQVLKSQGITAAECEIDLTVLYDPATQGSLTTPAIEGLHKGHRAIMANGANRSVCCFDPDGDAKAIVARMNEAMRLPRGTDAALYSFGVVTSCTKFEIAKVPKPVAGPSTRPPAVAGRFYPANATELRATVQECVPSNSIERNAGEPLLSHTRVCDLADGSQAKYWRTLTFLRQSSSSGRNTLVWE